MSFGGGSSTTTQELPAWLEDAAKKNLAQADYVSQLGYVPQYGVDVAGFTPMQQSAMQNSADAASAFGLSAPTDVMAGMPQMRTDASGFTGYSSGDIFDTRLGEFANRRPAQYSAMQGMFIDPLTGDLPINFQSGGVVAIDPNAQMSVPTTMSSGGQNMATGGGWSPAYVTQNDALSLMGQDIALGLSTANPVLQMLSPISTIAANMYLDNQMEHMGQQTDMVYADQYADDPNSIVVSDENGNLNVVNLSEYSTPGDSVTGSSTGGSTIYSGTSDTGSGSSGIGNSYYSSSGDSWSDYGGYTGVSGTGSDMGNDFEAFSNSDFDGNSSSGGSGGSSSGGTYCCTAMRKNGDWTSHIKVYRMHKWHFDQPQWWIDGYDVWGKIIADKLITKKGNFWAKCFDAFYEKHIKGGKSTLKSTVAEVMMYPAVFAIGMAKKLTGKHVEFVEVGE
jgi:hypothetical protein